MIDRPNSHVWEKLQDLKNFTVLHLTPANLVYACSEYAMSSVTDIKVSCEYTALSGDLPPAIVPIGLSQARQEYLYIKIRQYVADEFKDRLCLAPIYWSCSYSITSF